MAKSTKGQPLALELLSADHRKVEKLFEQYEKAKDGEESRRQELCEQICNELTVHAQVEEELFYPWLRENLDEEDMVEEATVEHETLKSLISQLEGAEVDETYNAKVKVLGEYVKHHVKEEENEIFPEVRDKSDELDELGQEMASRKAEIMEELGIEADESEEDEEEEKSSGRSSRSGDPGRATR